MNENKILLLAAPPILQQPGYYGGPAPVGGDQAPPHLPPGCPPGLQYLTMLDQLLVKQKVELLEAFTGHMDTHECIRPVLMTLFQAGRLPTSTRC